MRPPVPAFSGGRNPRSGWPVQGPTRIGAQGSHGDLQGPCGGLRERREGSRYLGKPHQYSEVLDEGVPMTVLSAASRQGAMTSPRNLINAGVFSALCRCIE